LYLSLSLSLSETIFPFCKKQYYIFFFSSCWSVVCQWWVVSGLLLPWKHHFFFLLWLLKAMYILSFSLHMGSRDSQSSKRQIVTFSILKHLHLMFAFKKSIILYLLIGGGGWNYEFLSIYVWWVSLIKSVDLHFYLFLTYYYNVQMPACMHACVSVCVCVYVCVCRGGLSPPSAFIWVVGIKLRSSCLRQASLSYLISLTCTFILVKNWETRLQWAFSLFVSFLPCLLLVRSCLGLSSVLSVSGIFLFLTTLLTLRNG
jgi:hypothetical protein